jgi:hypothetical protein
MPAWPMSDGSPDTPISFTVLSPVRPFLIPLKRKAKLMRPLQQTESRPPSSSRRPSTRPPVVSGRPSQSTSSLKFVRFTSPFSHSYLCSSPGQFYTAPTAIRLLRRLGEHHTKGHDLSTLRTIGSVGEPINPEAWEWYWEHVGNKECAVVDTYWQTETGSIIITCVLPSPSSLDGR